MLRINSWILTAVSLALAASCARGAEAVPKDDDFVQAHPDGHLYLKGERVRYWGLIGWLRAGAVNPNLPPAERAAALKKARADTALGAQRIVDLGFNSYRNWYTTNNHDYTVGDGSDDDLTAYFLAELDRLGVKVWISQTNDLGGVTSADVDAVNDPATAAAWTAAINQVVGNNGGKPADLRCGQGSFPGLLRVFDPRYEAVAIQRMKHVAEWPNKYKGGLRLCDDPQNIVWEISNEETWLWGMFSGRWQQAPVFFRNELIARWCAFLKSKYGTDARLQAAWHSLLPGESLASETIMLAPLASPVKAEAAINDSNPAVRDALRNIKSEWTRDDFARQRGEDVVAFFTGLLAEHKLRMMKALKSWGKSCRLSPCLFDAGEPYQVQLQYVSSLGDAISSCSYIKGMGHDPNDALFPFKSGLTEPPRICWDVPWLEQASVVGKPFFVYETQIDQRTKYRAEFPARIAALGAIQDWDIVNWHIYGHTADSSNPNPFDTPLAIWHDYLSYGGDEVQCSAMRACAEIFKHGLLAPPPKPTVVTVSRRTLYDPASMDYGRSYGSFGEEKKIIPTAWKFGLRFRFDPKATDDAVDGAVATQGVLESCPLKPTPQLEFDWHQGCLIMDAPGVISYSGFAGARHGEPIDFTANKAQFSAISVANPSGIAYPVRPEELYVAITLASADGQPLADCKRAVLSAVSTSFNTGYKLDLTKSSQGAAQEGPKDVPPREFWGAWAANGGTLPVLVARVGVTVNCAAIDGMKYAFKDWHMRTIGEGTITHATLAIPNDQKIFIIELSR